MFSQDLISVDGASVNLSESGGKIVIAGSLSKQLGGGSVAGAVEVSGQLSLSMDAKVLVTALFALIESKSPAGVVLIEEEVKAAALAVLSKA